MNINRIEQDKKSCVGCNNCQNVCPQNAIQMRENEEGFFSPYIDDNKCVSCGKCIESCQMYQANRLAPEIQECYVSISKNKTYYNQGASGGIFGTIADWFFKEFPRGCVVGAAFQSGKVSHILVQEAKSIKILQNSKYVQSDLTSIFQIIKLKLEYGSYVLFSGTPCQVFALKLYLKSDFFNLFTIDLICHGVPSASFLQKDLSHYGNNITDLKFRHKKLFLKSRSGFILSFHNKGKKKYILSNRDPYYAMFMKNLSFRTCCYDCKFANLDRVGDLTLGDCDSYELYNSFHPKEATSTVIINTTKGQVLWKSCNEKFDSVPMNLRVEAKINTQLRSSSVSPPERNIIMKDILQADIDFLKKKYAKPNGLKAKILLLRTLF